jgi:hypothetical protein
VVARPGRWGNPFEVGARVAAYLDHRPGEDPLWQWGDLGQYDADHRLTRAESVAAFGAWVNRSVGRSGFARSYEARLELAGRDLACWCPLDEPCHADVLLQIANGGLHVPVAVIQKFGQRRAAGDRGTWSAHGQPSAPVRHPD